MRVLVEHTAEPVSSAYVQVDDPLRIHDRIWDGTQRGHSGQSLMGSYLTDPARTYASVALDLGINREKPRRPGQSGQRWLVNPPTPSRSRNPRAKAGRRVNEDQ